MTVLGSGNYGNN